MPPLFEQLILKGKSMKKTIATSLIIAAMALSGCAQIQGMTSSSDKTENTADAKASEKKTAEAKTTAKSSDPHARKTVKGLKDWEGYVEGKPAPRTKFTRLKIGMSEKQVVDLIGKPNDSNQSVTGKAWIPFYHGSGKVETMMYYKGNGRLLFSSDAGYQSSMFLIGIEHDASEDGYM